MTKKKQLTPTAKMLQQSLLIRVGDELEEFPDKYGIDKEDLEDIEVTMYVKQKNQEAHKGGRTKFMKIYETETKLLFENKVVDFKEFGFLTFLGALFTSYEDNVLKMKDGTPCTQKDIILASGMSRSSVSPLLTRLIQKNLIFETVNSEVANGKMYLLNPMLFYKGTLMTRKKKEIYKQIEQPILESWASNNNTTKETKQKIDEAIIAIVDVENTLTMDSLNRGIREETNSQNVTYH
jgi:hypothetical protein